MTLSAKEERRVAYLQNKLKAFDAQLGRLIQYLDGLNVDSTNAKMRLDSLSPMYESSRKYNDELTSLQSEDPQITVFLKSENLYFDAASAVIKLQRPDPFLNSTLNSNNITIVERQELPKLPEMKVPTFDGQRKNWASYKNKFSTLIDSRTDISDAVKCSQLFDSLVGPARAKVEQFEPNAENYKKAWQTLLEFYDHKRMVAIDHLNAILDLPQMSKVSADELSKLLDQTQQHVHILDGLGARSGDHLIVRIVERCLPPVIRRKWEDKLDMDELPKLEDLLKFIRSTIFKQQTSSDSSTSNQIYNSKKRSGEHLPQPSTKVAKTTSYAFSTSSSNNSSSDNSSLVDCPKCKGNHHLFKCPAFNGLNIQERWNFVKSIKACHNCLWVHQFPCKSDKRCKKCSRNHHTLLHNEKKPQQIKVTDTISSVSPNGPL